MFLPKNARREEQNKQNEQRSTCEGQKRLHYEMQWKTTQTLWQLLCRTNVYPIPCLIGERGNTWRKIHPPHPPGKRRRICRPNRKQNSRKVRSKILQIVVCEWGLSVLTPVGIASPDLAITHRFAVLCARHIDPRTSLKLGRAIPLDPPNGGGDIAYTGTQHPSSPHANACFAAGDH